MYSPDFIVSIFAITFFLDKTNKYKQIFAICVFQSTTLLFLWSAFEEAQLCYTG